MEKVVKTAHKAYYDNPIQLKAGEAFTLSGRSDAWGDNPKLSGYGQSLMMGVKGGFQKASRLLREVKPSLHKIIMLES